LVVACRTREQEVAGSSLTHCAYKYGPRQVADAHLPLVTTQCELVLAR